MDIKDICFEIENDDFYKKFLTENVKPVIDENLSVTDQITKLAKGIEKLNSNLEKQVLLKHHDLLTQASHATNVESVLSSVQIDVHKLLSGTDILRSKVIIPYNNLKIQTDMLERVQETCHLMRHISKILALFQNLAIHENNPPKQTTILYDLGELISDNDFEGIDLLDNIIEQVNLKRKSILSNSIKQLQDSLLAGDKVKLLECFKVFQNLHCTRDQINRVITEILNEIAFEIKKGFQIQATTVDTSIRKSNSVRGAPGKANMMNTNELKNKLWDNIEKLFSQDMYKGSVKVVMLQNVLNELHTIGNFRNIATTFWQDLAIKFSFELEKSAIAINQCIEIDFPRLLKCYNDLISRLKYKAFYIRRETLTKWENAFLSKSLGRLLDPVRGMWHSSQVPNHEQIDAAVRVISSALTVSLGDKQLSVSLANSVAKCIKQMSVEGEQRMNVENEVAQIIEAPTSSQQRNADLCNILYYFTSQINRVLNTMNSTLPAESIQIVQDSLKEISSLPVLQLFAKSISSALELILLTIHDETDLKRNDDPTGRQLSCSLYMKELQQFISRCRDIYFTMFNDVPSVHVCCMGIAIKCVHKFLQHVCTVSPISKYGRAKLQVDCKQLEEALSPLVSDLNDIGEPYRQLRALGMLLEKKPSEIVESQAKGASVPYSLVMMYLFSYAGTDLASPHKCAGWNIQQLMQWLESHKSEKDRLEFVAGALQRYQNLVRQNNSTTYDEIYPLLLQLYEDGKKHL